MISPFIINTRYSNEVMITKEKKTNEISQNLSSNKRIKPEMDKLSVWRLISLGDPLKSIELLEIEFEEIQAKYKIQIQNLIPKESFIELGLNTTFDQKYFQEFIASFKNNQEIIINYFRMISKKNIMEILVFNNIEE